MKKSVFFISIFLNSVLSFSANAETVLYCQEELATGLIKDKSAWKTGNFIKERYTIKFNNDYSRLEGLGRRGMVCRTTYSKNIVSCADFSGDTFLYNRNYMRFALARMSIEGYVNAGEDSDNLSIGTCKDF